MLWHGVGAQHCVQSNAEQPTTTRLQLRVVASSCPAQRSPPPGADTVDGDETLPSVVLVSAKSHQPCRLSQFKKGI